MIATSRKADPLRLAFSALLKLVAPDQVLFGSDYPFAPETTMTATVKGLADLGLPAEVLQAIELLG